MTVERPVVAVLTTLGESHLARMATATEVARATSVAALPVEARRRCRVVVLRSEANLGAAELAELPGLTDVVRPGSGTDNIALDVLEARGIRLHRNADVSADAVAELAVAGLTVLCRRMGVGYRWLLDGTFAKHRLMGEPLAAQRVAVWGAGPIGRALHRRLEMLGMDTGFVRHPSLPDGLPVFDRAEAMAEADVHVLAVPLRPTTRRMVDEAWLAGVAARRPYLVNVGRYELIDQDAVAAALQEDRLRGCYLDPVDAGLAAETDRFLAATRDANVFATQHQGAQRSDVRGVLDAWAVRRVLDVLSPELGGN
ncbi:NAD(P)-dependent oxidoreductase [Kitasatospora sp. NPDC089913]|uniref:NAD(P)-dependent oxidoreductase n=1 Tax=Kitasatospora sp. NPDC089913 TaxID=3364080 RepID=UPI00382FDA8A